MVLSVDPAPDASRLGVTIKAPPHVSVQIIEEAIARASGFLRSAVADAITRKKAPTLVYFVVP